MKKEERIIMLGNSNSGKSNYMGLSLACIRSNWNDLPMVGMNSNFIDNINQSENRMQRGEWLGKTTTRTQHHFKAKLPGGIPFVTSEYKFFVDDWTGEAFEKLKAAPNENKGESYDKLTDEEKERVDFEDAIKASDSYVIFLDGEKLKNRGVESDVQKSLRGLQLVLQRKDLPFPLSERRFAFVVTKADVLENLKEFTHESKDDTPESGDGLDLSKLQKHVKSKYATFFDFLDWHKLEYRIFAVSCVPLKEHRQVDPKKGTMPTKYWSLKDMERVLVHVDDLPLLQKAQQIKALQQTPLQRQIARLQESERQRHDQLAPFRWLFRYNGD